MPQCFYYFTPKKDQTHPQHVLLGTKYINLPYLATINLPNIKKKKKNISHTIYVSRGNRSTQVIALRDEDEDEVCRQCECDSAKTLKRSCVKTGVSSSTLLLFTR